MFPLYLLSGFGSGIISVMNYGKNIADIPNTLITSQFANVSGIKLNEEFARKDYAGMNATFLHTSKLMIFILVPIGCFMFVFAEPIVALFYKKGSFTGQGLIDAAKFMQLLSITIFSIGINAIVTRIFIAMQAIKQSLLYQVVLNILLIAAIWLFTKSYGEYGYPYGIIFINLVNFGGMYFICRKYFTAIEYGKMLKYTAGIMAVYLPVSALLYYGMFSVNMLSFYKLLIGFCIYLFVFILMNRIKAFSVYEDNAKK